MAKVIHRGPAPGRPNPFARLGEGFSQGIAASFEQRLKDEEEEKKRKREREEAALGLRTLGKLSGPFDTVAQAETALASGVPFSTDTEGQQALSQIPASQRLASLTDEELAALSTNSAAAPILKDLFGVGSGESGFTLGSGQSRFDPQGNLIAEVPTTSGPEIVKLQRIRDEAEARGETRRAAELDRRINILTTRQGPQSNAVNLVLPDGSQATGRERPDGNLEMLTESGFRPVPVGTQKIGTTATGTPAEIGVTRKDLSGLRDQRIATRQALATIDDITRQVAGSPELLSASGFLSRATDTILAQAEGLANLTGINLVASRDPETYAEEFRKIGGPAAQSAQLQSAIVSLAFAAAAASGQSGRDVSDKDVERFIREIGANTGSPDTFIAVLESLRQRLDRNFAIRAEEIEGKKPQSLIESQQALPEGIPAGSVPAGRTKEGRAVFRAPDGQMWVE